MLEKRLDRSSFQNVFIPGLGIIFLLNCIIKIWFNSLLRQESANIFYKGSSSRSVFLHKSHSPCHSLSTAVVTYLQATVDEVVMNGWTHSNKTLFTESGSSPALFHDWSSMAYLCYCVSKKQCYLRMHMADRSWQRNFITTLHSGTLLL